MGRTKVCVKMCRNKYIVLQSCYFSLLTEDSILHAEPKKKKEQTTRNSPLFIHSYATVLFVYFQFTKRFTIWKPPPLGDLLIHKPIPLVWEFRTQEMAFWIFVSSGYYSWVTWYSSSPSAFHFVVALYMITHLVCFLIWNV